MKNILTILLLFYTLFASAQYCIFFEFEAKEPEMVVSTLKGMMDTEWGKSIQGTKSLFALYFNGNNQATHTMQFCFQDEAGLESFMTSWGQSTDAQLFGEKLGKFTNDVSQTVNTPAWYKNDWSNDNVFMIYQMEVTNPSKYVQEFAAFSQKMAPKYGFANNSYGVGYPIVGKTNDFSHFVWIGSTDIKTALAGTKQTYADPEFAVFSKKVASIRKVVNTLMMVKLADF